MDVLIAALSLVFAASLALGGPPRFLPPWTALFLLSAAILIRLRRDERRAGRGLFDARPDAALFWLCLMLYLASFRWHGGDDIPNSLLPFELWRHGTLAFDDFRAWATSPAAVDLIHDVRGRLVSTYPVAAGILAAPLYVPAVIFGAAPSDPFLHNMAKISGALITAASVVVFRRAAARRASPEWALHCALLYGLGSYAYSVSSQALYSHGPAQLGVALGLLGLLSEGDGWAAATGFGFALAWAGREDGLVFGAAAGAYLLFHRRERLWAFAAGAIVPVALNLAYWRYYSGAFRPPYYELQAGLFTGLEREALVAMLVSPSRGLLFFFPAAAFGVWGALKSARDPRARWIPYFAAACAATWIAFGLRASWTAGNSYGDRYFAVVCLVLALFAAELEDEIRATATRRAAWSAVFAFCVMMHAVGANFQWPGYRMTLDEQESTAWSLRMFPPVHLFVDGGPIDATPWPWRAPYGAALLGLASAPAWLWSRRRLGRKRVLFVCVENSCRSQMAEGFAKRWGNGRLESWSAGSRPSGRVNERAIRFMSEKGVALDGHASKGLSDLPPGRWDLLVTMGCGDECPSLAARTRADWDLPDPKNLSDDDFRRVRDDIEARVKALLQ